MRKYRAELMKEVNKVPGASGEFSITSKHQRLTISYGNQSRFVTFPLSPSDGRRGLKNTITDVRREMRRMGAIQ